MAKSNKKMTTIAVFDISSSSVAGAHTIVEKGSENTLGSVSSLASVKMFSQLKEDINIDRFVEQTISQLQNVITTIKKADNHKPSYVQIILSSPWFVSQTRSIIYSKTTDFVCNQKLIDELVQKEIDHIIENDMARFGDIGKDAVIIEKQISRIKLNGYSTSNPMSKKAQNLELFLVVTVAPKMIIERFKNEIKKEYSTNNIGFSTCTYAQAIVARDFLMATNEMMVIDIGEEVTDVAFVKDSVFLYQHSFPVGIYELYRTLIANNLSSGLEAGAIVESFYKGSLSPSMNISTQKSIDLFGSLWQKAFQQVINNGGYSLMLPHTAYISCDQRFEHFFSTVIQSDPLTQSIVLTDKIEVLNLNQVSLNSYVSSIDSESIDQAIIVASLFASRLL
jgi:hypothetical protein